MIARSIPYITAAVLLSVMKKTGGLSEILNFTGYKDTQLLGTIILNIVLILLFAEIYWMMDSSAEGKHFSFDGYIDSLYFTTVTSSSTGYGEITPKTRSARIVVMTHLLIQFFVLIPILLETLKPGN